MSLKGKSIHVLTPMYGGMCATNYHNSMMKLLAQCIELGIPFDWTTHSNDSLIPRARNILAHNYLEIGNASHAFYIDADVGIHPDDIVEMLRTDYDVLGVPCSKKSIRWDRVQKAIRRSPHELTPAELEKAAGDPVGNYLVPEGQTEKVVDPDQPQEMFNVGTGVLMIRREVFEKLKNAFPNNWYQRTGVSDKEAAARIWDFFPTGIDLLTHRYHAENFGFCELCKSAGIKLMLHPWIQTTHAGTYVYQGDLKAIAALTGEA